MIRIGRIVSMAGAWMGLLVGCDQIVLGPGGAQTFQVTPAPAATQAPAPQPRDTGKAEYMAETALRGDNETDGQGAVDIALEWSKKYAKAAEELLECQRTSKQLTEENRRLLAQNAKLQMQLEQSQKELAEGNGMLVELGKELREWKANVLGFRGEMQQAQQVQMEAIKKIMVLLGGEAGQPAGAPTANQVSSPKDASSEQPKGSNS